MSSKRTKIAELVDPFQGQDLDAHYLAYFECFNRGLFFEAHEVLEVLWLSDRTGSDGAFYKALIQLAGAFVHLQKDRPSPAAALFKLADENLQKYPPVHHCLDLKRVRAQIQTWLGALQSAHLTTKQILATAAAEFRLEPTHPEIKTDESVP